jgi:hypothetical protein
MDLDRTIPGDAGVDVEREADLITSAMILVASGASHRTTVAGLRRSAAAIAIARRRAVALGVVLEPIERQDGRGQDVIVRKASVRLVS